MAERLTNGLVIYHLPEQLLWIFNKNRSVYELYWPNIDRDIPMTQKRCKACNEIAASQSSKPEEQLDYI